MYTYSTKEKAKNENKNKNKMKMEDKAGGFNLSRFRHPRLSDCSFLLLSIALADSINRRIFKYLFFFYFLYNFIPHLKYIFTYLL